MKKVLLMIALFGVPACLLTGCGDSKPATVEAPAEGDSSMSDAQKKQYEEMMKSGGSSQSSQPGN